MRSLSLKINGLIILTLITCTHSFAQLRQLHNNRLGFGAVEGISFYSPKEGYLAQTFESFFTSDSGRTLVKLPEIKNNVDFNGNIVNLTFGFAPSGVHAFDKNRILMYGDYGNVPTILRSADGGQTYKLVWYDQPAEMPNPDAVYDIIFPGNGNIGYAIEEHRILKTTNKGETWEIVHKHSLLSANFTTLQVLDEHNIIASCNATSGDRLIASSDGGRSWRGIRIPVNTKVHSINFTSTEKGWINLSNGDVSYLYKTTNGGSSWTLVNDPVRHKLRAHWMRFTNDNEAFAMQEQLMEVFRTVDGGRVWERVPRDNDYQHAAYSFQSIFFLDNIFWTGGIGNFLQINSNPTGPVVPNANFLIDTTGFAATRKVNVLNRAGRQHRFEWSVNGKVVSTDYDLTYTHTPHLAYDTIRLIAYNDSYRDTVEQIRQFPLLPLLSSASPMIGGAGTVITIRGVNFRYATKVSLGGVDAQFKIHSDSLIEAIAAHGASGDVVVRNNSGYGDLPGFLWLPQPLITSFIPNSGKSGDRIVITGMFFEHVEKVQVGGLPVRSFNVISPERMEVILGSSGDGSISVTTPGGTGSRFGFTALPEIFSFSPMKATQASRVSIYGSGLDNVESVTVGGKMVSTILPQTSTLLNIVVPENSTGDIIINKRSANARRGTFTYQHKPVITHFTPVSAEPGTTIVITGAHFNPSPVSNVVSFGPVNGIVTAASATSLSVTVPHGAVYGPVKVSTDILSCISTQAFSPLRQDPVAITADGFSDAQPLEADFISGYTALAVCDLDGDKKTDVLLHRPANSPGQTDTVLLLLNNGDAAFRKRYPLLLPKFTSIHVADFNNDGKPDFCLYKNARIDSVVFYENHSTPDRPDFRRSAFAIALADKFEGQHFDTPMSADMDNDGKTDLVMPGGSIHIFRNIGNPGTLAFDTAYAYAPYVGTLALLSDLDGDGFPDLILEGGHVPNKSKPGKLLLGEAVLPFEMKRYSQISCTDLDNDGKPEIIYSNPGTFEIYIQKNNSVPGTIVLGATTALQGFNSVNGNIINDFDGDGKPDILSISYDGVLVMFRNIAQTGDIRFEPAMQLKNQPFGEIFTGDFNNDNQADILVLEGNTPRIYLNLGKPSPVIVDVSPALGAPGMEISISGSSFRNATGVFFGGVPAASFKVIGDTLIRAIAGNGGVGPLTVTNPAGTGSYTSFAMGPVPVITAIVPDTARAGSVITIRGHHFTPAVNGNVVQFGTVNAEVISADSNELKVTVPISAPYKRISVTTRQLSAYSNEYFHPVFDGASDMINESNFGAFIHFPFRIESGWMLDVDGDGKLDVLGARVFEDRLKFPRMEILLNTSTLDSFSFEQQKDIDLPFSRQFMDIDGDGKPDIIHSSSHVYRNTSTPGNVSFEKLPDLPGIAGNRSGGVYIMEDFDLDGKPDMITRSDYDCSFYRNTSQPGTVSFAPVFSRKYNHWNYRPAVGDLDGDGKPDIVNFTSYPGKLLVLHNTSEPGNISFRDITILETGNALYPSVDLKDIDGDGKLDMNVLVYLGKNIIFRNISTPGNIAFEQSSYVPKAVQDHRYFDLDGDGVLDMIQEFYNNHEWDDRALYIRKGFSTPGNINFSDAYRMQSLHAYSATFVGDLNGDGLPEIGSCIEWTSADYGLNIFPNHTGKTAQLYNCEDSPDSIATNIKSNTYQWQVMKDGQFVDLADNAEYQGTRAAELKMKSTPLTWNGNVYRCKTDDSFGIQYMLTVHAIPKFKPMTDTFYCPNTGLLKIGLERQEGIKYHWYPQYDSTSWLEVWPQRAEQFYYVSMENKAKCMVWDTIRVEARTQGNTRVVTQNPEMCAGGEVELIAEGGTYYQWYDDNSQPIPGANEKSYIAKATGYYSVAAVVNECWWMPQGVYVKSRNKFAPPSIVNLGEMITVTAGTDITWYRNDELIPGATGSSYKFERWGTYTARAGSLGCMSGNSNPVYIPHPEPRSFAEENIIAGPNPVGGTLYISFPNNGRILEIVLYHVNGNRLTEKATFTDKYQINMQPFQKGMYMVQITEPESGEKIIKRIIKQ